jgi:hypothetical protein
MIRRVGLATSVAILCGVVVGGIGGRIAMFVLRVTSSSAVIGIESDDGFEIGRISFSTLILLVITGIVGAAGGPIYLLLRQWVPDRWRVWATAVLAGVIGGTGLLNPGGVDFTLLGPLWLAVLLFILIPVGYGAALSVFVEEALARESERAVPWWAFLPNLALLLFAPAALMLAAVVLSGWALGHVGPVGRWWRSPVVVWLGRALLVVALIRFGLALGDDVRAIL